MVINFIFFQEDTFMNVVLNFFIIKINNLNVFWYQSFPTKHKNVFCLKNVANVNEGSSLTLVTKGRH